MAGRNNKESLDYFPVYMDIFDHPKMLMAQELIDPDGILPQLRLNCPVIYIRFLKEIYSNSYYLHWDDSKSLDFSKTIGSGITYTHIKRFIDVFFDVGLLSRCMYQRHSVLTGEGVIETWLSITIRLKRRVDKSKAVNILKTIIDVDKPIVAVNNSIVDVKNGIDGIDNSNSPFTTTTKYNIVSNSKSSRRKKNKDVVDNAIVAGNNGIVDGDNAIVAGNNGIVDGDNAIVAGNNGIVDINNYYATHQYNPKTNANTLLNVLHCAEEYKFNPTFKEAKSVAIHAAGFGDTEEEVNRFDVFVDVYARFQVTSSIKVKKMADFSQHFFLWLQKQGQKLNGDPTIIYKFKKTSHNGDQQSGAGKDQPTTNGNQPLHKHTTGGVKTEAASEFLNRKRQRGNPDPAGT